MRFLIVGAGAVGGAGTATPLFGLAVLALRIHNQQLETVQRKK